MNEYEFNNDDVARAVRQYDDEGIGRNVEDDFITSYKEMWRSAFDLHYGTERSDFWKAFLIHFMVIVIPMSLFLFVIWRDARTFKPMGSFSLILFWLTLVFLIGYLTVSAIPFLHLTIRRIKDTGFSPWFILLGSLPFIHSSPFFIAISLLALFALMVMLVLPSHFKI